jgi:hypothetical protein
LRPHAARLTAAPEHYGYPASWPEYGGSGRLIRRGILNKSPNRRASPARRLVIEATIQV